MNALPARSYDSKQHDSVEKKKSAKGKVIPLRQRKKHGLSDAERADLVIEYRIKGRKLGRSILRKWHARLDLEEVDSVVDLSLCEAVKRFNPEKGASFITFFYYHLRGNLIRAVSSAANSNLVPVCDLEEYISSSVETAKTQTNRGHTVSALDIADALTSRETAAPDEILFRKELVQLSAEACDRLDELEREVIQRIFFGEQQLQDIARELGYSRCHISRVKKKALENLKGDLTGLLEQAEKVEELSEEAGKYVRRKPRRVVHRRRSGLRNKRAERASA